MSKFTFSFEAGFVRNNELADDDLNIIRKTQEGKILELAELEGLGRPFRAEYLRAEYLKFSETKDWNRRHATREAVKKRRTVRKDRRLKEASWLGVDPPRT